MQVSRRMRLEQAYVLRVLQLVGARHAICSYTFRACLQEHAIEGVFATSVRVQDCLMLILLAGSRQIGDFIRNRRDMNGKAYA